MRKKPENPLTLVFNEFHKAIKVLPIIDHKDAKEIRGQLDWIKKEKIDKKKDVTVDDLSYLIGYIKKINRTWVETSGYDLPFSPDAEEAFNRMEKIVEEERKKSKESSAGSQESPAASLIGGGGGPIRVTKLSEASTSRVK